MTDTQNIASNYSASNIQVLEGLEAVRIRPGMYIGSTGPRGLPKLVYEIVDNSVDEALAGYASHIEITILPDNGIRVVDDGRGIPVDEVPGGGVLGRQDQGSARRAGADIIEGSGAGAAGDQTDPEPLTAQGERGIRLGILHGGKGGGGAPIENQYLTPQINKMLFYITK